VTTIELTIDRPAHGGHCVARLDGRVVFVRHALSGERVVARLTDDRPDARYWRAEVVEVLDASEDRVDPAWPEAGPGGVGGGELSHVSLEGQLAWKAAVLGEQLSRLARDDRPVEVRAAPGDERRGGLAYRTRIDLVADEDGRAGMHLWRSSQVQPVTSMPLAAGWIQDLDLFSRRWPAGARIQVAAPENDRPVVLVDGAVWDVGRHRADPRATARRSVHEEVGPYRYRVAADGFWQAHVAAPGVLVDAVRDAVGDVAGATVVELYAGAGLLTVPLADAVGADGFVHAVEGDARGVRDARRNVHDLPQVGLHHGDVQGLELVGEADVVVLDPPRSGAGRAVMERVAALDPDRVVYVACDPAALARDVGLLTGLGYRLDTVVGHDLFPMTHHVEAVATLVR
jgi:tRNA/tmRNA/rRNA uracil-C5-methylase (TrmA/RlmC/RlmD family)